jgi:hypothetical protein
MNPANPATKRSEILGQIVKVAAELNDWHALIELLRAARNLQRQIRIKTEVEKGSAAKRIVA